MKKYTPSEKKEYFRHLRERWNEAKKLSETQGNEIRAIIATHGLNISQTGYMFVSIQMRHQGLDGLPYLDAKTFQGWRDNGFRVKKGETSTLSGITWVSATKKNDDDSDEKDFKFPKQYRLFHRSQVEPAA